MRKERADEWVRGRSAELLQESLDRLAQLSPKNPPLAASDMNEANPVAYLMMRVAELQATCEMQQATIDVLLTGERSH